MTFAAVFAWFAKAKLYLATFAVAAVAHQKYSHSA
jgi:hypothetical protein